MVDIGSSNPVTDIMDSTMDLPSSSSSSELLTLTVRDRLNMVGNMKHPPSKLEFVVQFDKDNCSVMRSRPINARRIILFPFLKAASSLNPEEEDKVAFMPKLHWIGNDIQSTPAHLDWQMREVIETLIKKRYKIIELKESSIFLKV